MVTLVDTGTGVDGMRIVDAPADGVLLNNLHTHAGRTVVGWRKVRWVQRLARVVNGNGGAWWSLVVIVRTMDESGRPVLEVATRAGYYIDEDMMKPFKQLKWRLRCRS